jgi:hypothetical protein
MGGGSLAPVSCPTGYEAGVRLSVVGMFPCFCLPFWGSGDGLWIVTGC